MKCRRVGCEETVLSWLDPDFCSDTCRAGAGWKRTAGVRPVAAPLADEQSPAAASATTPAGDVRGHRPDLVILDEIQAFEKEPRPPSMRGWLPRLLDRMFR